MKAFISNKKLYISVVFAITEFALYLAFLIPEAMHGGDHIAIKYSGILLCLVTASVLIFPNGKDGIAVTAALFFTAISDLFIFVLQRHMEIGLVTFIITQLVYYARITLTHGKKPYISAAVRVFMIAVVLIALGVTNNLSPLVVLAGIYFPLLLCNAAESLFLIKISKRYLLFFAGLLLFIGCDICVGLHNFALLGVTLPDALKIFVSRAIWAFYLPSQVLIVLSCRNAEYKNPFNEFFRRVDYEK